MRKGDEGIGWTEWGSLFRFLSRIIVDRWSSGWILGLVCIIVGALDARKFLTTITMDSYRRIQNCSISRTRLNTRVSSIRQQRRRRMREKRNVIPITDGFGTSFRFIRCLSINLKARSRTVLSDIDNMNYSCIHRTP